MSPTTQDVLQQALRSHQTGDLATAERLYRQILAQAPRQFNALHLLGVIRAQQQNFKEAERLIAKAVESDPTSAEAHNNLGNVLSELDRHEQAIMSFQRALQIQPNNAGAYYNLGNALKKLRKHEEAAACYAAAVRLQPDYDDALFNLANILRHLNRQEEAMPHLRRIIARHPRDAEAHTALGQALQELGRFDEARPAFERAIALNPTSVDAHLNLIAVRGGKPDERHLKEMEALAGDGARLAHTERSVLHYTLGKAYEMLGRDDEAFAHLFDANRLRRQSIPYDEAAARARFERLQQMFTRELLAEKPGLGSDSNQPIFVVGFPRSGTTLTEQILASHPEVHGAGELGFIGELAATVRATAGKQLFFPECLPFLPANLFRKLGEAYVRRLRTIAPAAPRITDKMPANHMFVGFIRLILPNARIIHVKRDAVDTCVSCFSLYLGEGLDFANDLGELGRHYRMYSELMDHWRDVLPAHAMLHVQYEELVGDLEGQARRILDYCGLPWDDRCLAFHETERSVTTASVLQVRQPIYRSSLQRWRRYERHLGPLLEALGPAAKPSGHAAAREGAA
ncbi:MAG: hypothetical protein QOK29_1500 [Rhodospirillaceae bacterium]|nr:hypothetical protein [Rhodospirillaceae bacterium]